MICCLHIVSPCLSLFIVEFMQFFLQGYRGKIQPRLNFVYNVVVVVVVVVAFLVYCTYLPTTKLKSILALAEWVPLNSLYVLFSYFLISV